MARMNRWLASAGLLLALGCGGKSAQPSNGQPNNAGAPGLGVDPGNAQAAGAPSSVQASGGQPGGGTSSAQAGGAPSSGPASGGQGPGTAPGCVGTLDDVNQIGGAPCPATLCAANAWASDCAGLPDTVVKSALGACTEAPFLSLQLSGGGAKTCYYDPIGTGGPEPHLMAVAVSTNDSSLCGGTSNQTSAGNVPSVCKNIASVVCDRTGSAGAGGASESDAGSVPPALCFDLFSQTCAPCCPDNVDCTGKPDGYPGYECTSTSNAYCSCSCGQEQWRCGC
jgi:hypothetical protein